MRIHALLAALAAATAFAQDADVLHESGTSVGGFATHSVAGGNQRIALELAAGLGDRVHLGSPVRRVARSDDGVRVGAGGAEVEADEAVIAVPASVIDRITFVLRGEREYYVLCRWPADEGEPSACGTLQATFKAG